MPRQGLRGSDCLALALLGNPLGAVVPVYAVLELLLLGNGLLRDYFCEAL